jgi:hypothetical protein
MKNLLLAAAAATLVVAVSPAFANIGTEAEEGYAVYPSVGQCHFVRERVVTQTDLRQLRGSVWCKSL